MNEGSHDRELDKCTIVVTCVMLQKNARGDVRTLILKRSETEEEGPGLWTIPGGRVRVSDLGEKLYAQGISHDIWTNVLSRAILREILEETGIGRENLRPMFLPGREKIFLRKDGTPTLAFVFWAEEFYGMEPQAGEGATECRWASEGELDGYTFIGNVKDDIRAAFRALHEREAELRKFCICDKNR